MQDTRRQTSGRPDEGRKQPKNSGKENIRRGGNKGKTRQMQLRTAIARRGLEQPVEIHTVFLPSRRGAAAASLLLLLLRSRGEEQSDGVVSRLSRATCCL